MPRLLHAQGLRAGYGTATVLHDLDLHVDQGEVVAVIGANGAGKSTLLLALMGLLPAWAGEITFDGEAVAATSTFNRARRGLMLVPERRQLFGEMTVEENLLLGAYSSARPDLLQADLAEQYRRFPRLAERRGQKTRLMSGGEQQIVAIARGLMARPRLLLLDEPSLGLSPSWVKQIMSLVVELRRGGMTILLVEQNAREALELADRGYVMETGRIVQHGAARLLLADTSLSQNYLGGEGNGAPGIEDRLRAYRAQT